MGSRRKRRLAARLVGLLVLAPVAFAGTREAQGVRAAPEPTPLRVLSAASLTEVVEDLAAAFEDGHVVTVFGASSELARQIRDGAPADVFLSASPDWIAFLREAGALAGDPVVLARNRLACIATPGSPLAGRVIPDARALLDELGPHERIAIADEGVPAGDAARRALAQLGLQGAARSRLVGQKDVRAVLHAVEQGELPAGFVYTTDAKLASVPVLFVFDPASHPPIEYQAAALSGAASPAAASRFLAYLQSEAARALLDGAGFLAP